MNISNTFINRSWREVLDIIIRNRMALDLVSDWQVSLGHSFSVHMYVDFKVNIGGLVLPMYRNKSETNWYTYETELDHSISTLSVPNSLSSASESSAFETAYPLEGRVPPHTNHG